MTQNRTTYFLQCKLLKVNALIFQLRNSEIKHVSQHLGSNIKLNSTE